MPEPYTEKMFNQKFKKNIYENKWKIKSNLNKFKMIMIGNIPKQHIQVENVNIEYSNKAKILGLNFKSRNFFKNQVDENIRYTSQWHYHT